jgi:hypothetical protein
MCIIADIYTAEELKALDKKSRAALQKHCRDLVHTSPAIKNIVKRDPRIQKKLKSLLRGKY